MALPDSVISPVFSSLLTLSLLSSVQPDVALLGDKRCRAFPDIIRMVLSIQPKQRLLPRHRDTRNAHCPHFLSLRKDSIQILHINSLQATS